MSNYTSEYESQGSSTYPSSSHPPLDAQDPTPPAPGSAPSPSPVPSRVDSTSSETPAAPQRNGSLHPEPSPAGSSTLAVPSPDLPPLPFNQSDREPSTSSTAPSPLPPSVGPSESRPSTDSATYVQSQNRQGSYRGHERLGSSSSANGWAPDFGEDGDVVPTGFDESVLRALCELDCGVPLLLDRIKQGMASCREVSAFLKKRAILEDDYGRAMHKLARSTSEMYSMGEGKAGSFVTAWQQSLRLHEAVAENRLRLASRLNEMSEELLNLAKEVERNRKTSKELGARYERTLQEAEATTDKAKSRFDSTAEELERLLVLKEGETMKEAGLQQTRNNAPGQSGKRVLGKAINKGGLLLKGRNPASILRQEEDIRQRMSTSSDAYRKAVLETQHIRGEYFNFQLPRILRSLKECADEIDLGTQYHMSRYAFLYESTMLSDGSALAPLPGPDSGPGLKDIMEGIDSRGDFKVYMQNYAVAHAGARGPRREGPPEEGLLSPISHVGAYPSPIEKTSTSLDKGRPTFGIDLGEQMARDASEVPRILERCATAIEANGLASTGIYRLSGMTSRVNKLKAALDRDVETHMLDEEAASDVNIVCGALKLWLRELPEPLFTHALYNGFIDAAKIENERLRHIRLHERVNELPDANYATLKYLMGHLDRIRQNSDVNQMRVSNIAIVFGPTLLGPPLVGATTLNDASPAQTAAYSDPQWQSKAVETILEHYKDIFVEEGEEVPV